MLVRHFTHQVNFQCCVNRVTKCCWCGDNNDSDISWWWLLFRLWMHWNSIQRRSLDRRWRQQLRTRNVFTWYASMRLSALQRFTAAIQSVFCRRCCIVMFADVRVQSLHSHMAYGAILIFNPRQDTNRSCRTMGMGHYLVWMFISQLCWNSNIILLGRCVSG